MDDDEGVAEGGVEAEVDEDVPEDLELTDDEAGEVKGGDGVPFPTFLGPVKPSKPGSGPPFTGS